MVLCEGVVADMLSARKRWTIQRNLMLLGLCLAVYHVAVYRPLCRRAGEIDRPLAETWGRLLEISPHAKSLGTGYVHRIEMGLAEALASSQALDEVRRRALVRIELDGSIRARMDQPFQLIEFQNERQVRLEELARLAGQAKVGLGSGVAEGFPEYAAGRPDPTLLWPQLAVAHHLVAAAIQSQVSTVAVVRLPPMMFHGAQTNPSQWLVEIPVEMEVAGPAPAISRMLELLPLRAEEAKARGFPEPLPGKPVVFLQGLLLRKEGREPPDRVQLRVSANSFVLSNRSGPE
jgi:hypothetical protein